MAQEERPQRADPGKAGPAQRQNFRWWWVWLTVGLLVVNFWAGAQAMQEQSRLTVPYSPFFLDQVREGNVAEVTSKGTAIQGDFKQPRAYGDSKATKEFKTEIPAFADSA